MAGVSSEEEDDEFEDTDEFGKTPKTRKSRRRRVRPDELSIDESRSVFRSPTAIILPPRTPLGHVTVPTASKDSSSHRDRLQALRHRMTAEFGQRDTGSCNGSNDNDDAMSTLSEATSIHSWHRRVLAAPHSVMVHATDTMSTCAGSVRDLPTCSFSSPNSTFTDDDMGRNDRIFSQNAGKVLSPSSPPPVPSREGFSPQKGRTPPPLPPRNPSIRLPDPVAKEIISRINKSEEMEREKEEEAQKLVEAPLDRSARKSTDEEETNGSPEKKKGHTKSNSLDRGLTLAKSIKSGPFPPPANKSNSLKKEANGEEEVRNWQAEGIIRQITTSLENNTTTNDILETITSADNSSISSPSPSCSTNQRERRTDEELVHSSRSCGHDPMSSRFREELKMTKSVSNQEVGGWSRQEKHSTSFDPIAQDVERRLSMKRDGTLPDDCASMSDDGVSRRSITSVDHAKKLARNSLAYASGFFRGAIQKMRSMTTGNLSSRNELGEESSEDEDASESSSAPHIGSIVRPRKTKKGPYDFEQLTIEQELDKEHTGAVWCIKFSICGRLMATAGQDSILRIWVVRSHLKYFSDMREKYHIRFDEGDGLSDFDYRPPSSEDSVINSCHTAESDESSTLFVSKPFAVLKGHTSDVLDLSWSKNYFVLSSGMDRTAKLWHISRNECLCCFQHVDFVTCVAFLPKDDRYFLSGSLDGKLRLWHIPDKKVAVWNEVQVKFITAITFVKNGKFAVVGTYNGRCYFYSTDQLKYHTVVDVRSSRGRNARGHKVTGLAVHGDKLLVTSNDSRIRMYDVRDKALTCKFRGVQNEHSQIRASFSPDGRHIVCGSEDKFVYLWRTSDNSSTMSVRKDRNSMWERVRGHNAPVSVAVFAPKPQFFLSMINRFDKKKEDENMPFPRQETGQPAKAHTSTAGNVIVSADLNGSIKVMVNRPRHVKAGHSTFY